VHGPDYGTRWHFHPEYQITLAIRSRGHRVVGDNISPLRDGDLMVLGSNLSHIWHQDEVAGASEESAQCLPLHSGQKNLLSACKTSSLPPEQITQDCKARACAALAPWEVSRRWVVG
jgi:hypothetical protein